MKKIKILSPPPLNPAYYLIEGVEERGGYWLTHTKKNMYRNAKHFVKRNYLFINLMKN